MFVSTLTQYSFEDRIKVCLDSFVMDLGSSPSLQDTLKISGMQVSPTEIEEVLLAHPERLLADVSVAGVSGGRSDDEKVPRAWVVLSAAGATQEPKAVEEALHTWLGKQLSKYKQLRWAFSVPDFMKFSC
jgi:acyl-CoA synthetase (AMP-forming)/AMP-acid ligase II